MPVIAGGNVASREEMLAAENTEVGKARLAALEAMLGAFDDESVAPSAGLRVTTERVMSDPDHNSISIQFIHPDNAERVPCVYYIHGGGMTEAFPWDEAPRYLIRDCDGSFGPAYTRRVRAMGIRDHPIAPRSPWQNGYAERLIGSLRRECTDHLIVFSEAHLRRILKTYASYYNQVRTHLALDKDAPNFRRRQLLGNITARPVLGGLHHHYVRV